MRGARPIPFVSCHAFELSRDVVEMTGVKIGDAPDWAYRLACLTATYTDPYVVMHHMVRDEELFRFLERSGAAMLEAKARSASFDLGKIASVVRGKVLGV